MAVLYLRPPKLRLQKGALRAISKRYPSARSHAPPKASGFERLPFNPNEKDITETVMSFSWWEEVDSNHRSRRRQIYSLMHLATLQSARISLLKGVGAGDWNRTRNLLITNQLLCQLSYTSKRQVFWCLGVESNRRHMDFQSTALPTELPRHF